MKICSIENCTRKAIARTWCGAHVARFYKHGDPNVLMHRTVCTVEGCGGKHSARGLCSRHFEAFRRDSGYKAATARKPNARYTDCVRYAKHRNLLWDIPLEDYKVLISKTCEYCAGPLPETKVGLDRIDNSLGYTLTNVVPCCRYCNQMRSNIFTYQEFKDFSKTELFKTILDRLHNRIFVK